MTPTIITTNSRKIKLFGRRILMPVILIVIVAQLLLSAKHLSAEGTCQIPGTCPVVITSWSDDYNPEDCNASCGGNCNLTVHSTVIISNTAVSIVIDTVSPTHLSEDFTGIVDLTGHNLDTLADIRFIRTGEPDLVGTINYKSADTAGVDFSFTDAHHGSWDLRVTSISGLITIKHNAIEITEH